eukprot:6191249-Pleurochrysis_carterae.AAC.1
MRLRSINKAGCGEPDGSSEQEQPGSCTGSGPDLIAGHVCCPTAAQTECSASCPTARVTGLCPAVGGRPQGGDTTLHL